MRTRVKICGITRETCLQEALRHGADALGFNMFEKSPRFVEVDQARKLLDMVPVFVTKVGLFVNEHASVIESKCEVLPFDLLQFHGDENDAFCRQFGKPFIKVLRINEVEDFDQTAEFPSAQGFLFDAYVEGLYGGTGKTISDRVLTHLPANAILAGGLKPENVGEMITAYRPYAVDVSSGVEIERGRKSPSLLKEFFHAVNTADRSKS